MTTITGFTSTRMLGIENNTVVSGTISGDDLILTKHDGTTVNAGDVRGPVGPQGPVGEVTTENLNLAIDGVNAAVSVNTSAIAQNTLDIANVEDVTSEIADRLPAGVVSMTIMQSIPSGWLELNGLTIPSAIAAYPELYVAAPASWKSGGDLSLPDMRGRMPVGQHASNSLFNQLEEKGGATSVTLQKANVPKHIHEMPAHKHTMGTHKHTMSAHRHTMGEHSHSINHNHAAFNTVSAGTHTHVGITTANGQFLGLGTVSSGSSVTTVREGGSNNVTTAIASGSAHAHSIDVPNFTGTSGPKDPGDTSYVDPGDTSSVDPGDTSNVDPGDTKDGTTDGLGANAFTTVSPYFVLRFIIKAH